MDRQVIGFFHDKSEADQVCNDLLSAGFSRNQVDEIIPEQGQHKPGVWAQIKRAFGMVSDEEQAIYTEAARRGDVAVAVDADSDADADRAARIMEQHNAIDLESEAEQWKQQGWAGYDAAPTAQPTATRGTQPIQPTQQNIQGEEVLPVTEEELRVGKRQVRKGGVRVYSRTTERPVEERVELREEHVNVERRPVDRPVTAADKAFQEKTIEATETAEEAVVSKQAKVVEEVVVSKETQQRTETVRDTVRRTDVEVEKLGGEESGRIGDTFADEIARDERYRGRDWMSVEPEARQSFEQRYPGQKWEQFKDSVGRGYEKMREKF